MKTSVKKNILHSLIFVVLALLIEMLLFIMLGTGIFPKYVFFDIAMILFIGGFIFIIHNDVFRSVVVCVLIFIACFFAVFNEVLIRTTNDVISLEKIFAWGPGTKVFSVNLLNWWLIAMCLLIIFISIVLVLLVSKIGDKQIKRKSMFFLILAVVMVCCQGFGWTSWSISYASLVDNPDDSFNSFVSEKVLFDTQSSKVAAFKKFGTYGFISCNLFYNIFSHSQNTITTSQAEDYAAYIKSGETEDTTTSVTATSASNNLITILAESLDYIAIDEYYTPNLYKLLNNNGLSMSEYYTNNKTNVSEGIVVCGNYSSKLPLISETQEVLNVVDNDYFEFTLPQKLKSDDSTITCSFFHNNDIDFYGRDETMPSVGFTNLVGKQEASAQIDELFESRPDDTYAYDNNFYHYYRDSDFVEVTQEQMVPSTGRFYTHYSAMSMHGHYRGRPCLQKYYDILTSNTEQANVQTMLNGLTSAGYTIPTNKTIYNSFMWYKAAAMDFDKAIGLLFDRLEATNHLEDTTVVIFADHDAYYDKLSARFKGVDVTDLSIDSSVTYHLPCIIYDQKLCNKLNGVTSFNNTTGGYTYTNFMSTFNITPTILDLFGIGYNPNLYMGVGIFDSAITNTVFKTHKDSNAYITNKIMLGEMEFKYIKEGTTQSEIDTFKTNCVNTKWQLDFIEALYTNSTKIFSAYAQL